MDLMYIKVPGGTRFNQTTVSSMVVFKRMLSLMQTTGFGLDDLSPYRPLTRGAVLYGSLFLHKLGSLFSKGAIMAIVGMDGERNSRGLLLFLNRSCLVTIVVVYISHYYICCFDRHGRYLKSVSFFKFTHSDWFAGDFVDIRYLKEN